MSYTAEEARTQVLDDIAAAVDQLALALACVGAAYEELDERAADVVEEQLFRPVQGAYGRSRRAYSEFAARHDLPQRTFEARSPGQHSPDPRVYVNRAIEACEEADRMIADLQDSMLPVEVGDQPLREGLAETRALIGEVPARGRRLLGVVGR